MDAGRECCVREENTIYRPVCDAESGHYGHTEAQLIDGSFDITSLFLSGMTLPAIVDKLQATGTAR